MEAATKAVSPSASTTISAVTPGGIPKKRGQPVGRGKHGKQSVAAKIRKGKETRAAKRESLSAKPTKGVKAPPPSELFNDELDSWGMEHEVERIVDSKIEKGDRFYLVKWEGYSHSENTWEPEVHLRNALLAIAKFNEAIPERLEQEQ